MISLRPYQEKGVEEIRDAYKLGLRSVLFYLPTGGGKTYTFSYIADSAGQKGGQVLICAHRKELVMQASMSLAKLGVEHSVIAPAEVVSAIKVQQVRELRRSFVKANAHVAVGSVQTIVRRLPIIAKPTLIIIDEAHHSTAGQWRDIINYFPKARILGVTATPCRTDGQGLGTHVGGVFDAMVLGPSMQELINLGSLVPAKIFYPGKFIDTTGMRLNPSGDYNQKAMDVAFESNRPTIVGNAVSFYKKHADGKKAVVFCTSVAAAQKTAETFCEAGYRFVSLDGTMDDMARRETVRQLSAGEIDGITSCDIVSEGFDCPDLEVAILMRPTNSESLYLQQIGRVLRPAPGKEYGIIIDMVGNTVNPELGGLPHWERQWSLDGGAQSKKGDGTEGKKVIQICTCPKCNAVHDPRPKCPECGHIYKVVARQIEQVEGDLVEMTPEMEVKLKEQKARKQQQGRAQSIEGLIHLALGQNRNPGWAYHVFINRPGNTMTNLRDGVESVIIQLSDQIKSGTAKDPAKVREQVESIRKAFGHKLTEHNLELRV